MNRHRFLIIAAAAFFPLAGIADAALLVYSLNDVRFRRQTEAEWKKAKLNMQLNENDGLRTLEQSQAKIKFNSGETLDVDENSLIIVRPEKKQDEISLLSGSIRTSKTKVLSNEAVIDPKVEPGAPAPDFKTKLKENQTTVVEVYEGVVGVTAMGKTVNVKKGYGTEIKRHQPPAEPQVLPAVREPERPVALQEQASPSSTRVLSATNLPERMTTRSTDPGPAATEPPAAAVADAAPHAAPAAAPAPSGIKIAGTKAARSGGVSIPFVMLSIAAVLLLFFALFMKKILIMVDRAAKDFAGFVNGLPDTKAEAGAPAAPGIDLLPAVQQAVATAKGSAVKMVALYLKAEDGLPKVCIAPDALEKLFAGLLAFVLRAVPEGGRVTVTLHKQDKAVETVIEYLDAAAAPETVAGWFEAGSDPLLVAGSQIIRECKGAVQTSATPGESVRISFTLPAE